MDATHFHDGIARLRSPVLDMAVITGESVYTAMNALQPRGTKMAEGVLYG